MTAWGSKAVPVIAAVVDKKLRLFIGMVKSLRVVWKSARS
ncbi:hypothetical protein MED193_19899 [Roseobacter sp. MED193]|nr:hypothetical protein MED193_19899 [Roseobacter sp. MED193]